MYLHCTHGEEECKYTVRAIRQAVRSRDQHWTIREGIPGDFEGDMVSRQRQMRTIIILIGTRGDWNWLFLLKFSTSLNFWKYIKCWKRKKEKQNDSEISGSFLFCNVKYLITQKMLLKNYFSLNMSIYHRKR